MPGPLPRNLALMLCLAVQVTVAPWLPCPCRWAEAEIRGASAFQREGADEGESRCRLCEGGKSARHCQQFPSTTHNADLCVAIVQATRLPDGHRVACGVALLHCSPSPSPDVHELQVLLE